jgi:hypothetical protein
MTIGKKMCVVCGGEIDLVQSATPRSHLCRKCDDEIDSWEDD